MSSDDDEQKPDIGKIYMLRLPAGLKLEELEGQSVNLGCSKHGTEPEDNLVIEDRFSVEVQDFECCSLTKNGRTGSERRVVRLQADSSHRLRASEPVSGYMTLRRRADAAGPEPNAINNQEALLPKRHCVEPADDLLERVKGSGGKRSPTKRKKNRSKSPSKSPSKAL